MTLKPGLAERARTVGHISRAAQVRVDHRVKEILARQVALDRAGAQPHASIEYRTLVEGLKWASEDAEQAERETVIREPQMAPSR
jgi:hypothetical protein